ncbi:MAG: enoyl-CoA hydratase [Rhodospirillales bacterium]|nr:enoyl-CoA hydratase [Rhodospirillales bacterium]|tara:strand:- start:1046 stop:1849 length:804 start_codon:yes stop_codon:yes gene_type:complete
MTELKLATEKMHALKKNGIGWMTFNNPARRNAIGFAMREAILEIIEDFETDPTVRVIVMQGAGDRSFVSGSDISEFAERRSTPEQREIYDALSAKVNDAYANIKKPLIAMIRGFCIGAGIGTAIHADIRIAAEGSQFGVPAARLGLGYAFRNMKKIIDIVGPAKTKEILFTGRRYSGDEALSMGLINQLVPADKLEEVVDDLASTIASNAPLTIHATKVIVAEAAKDPDKRDIALCDKLVENCMRSEDYKEGRTAFMEKRMPKFRGR